MPSKSGKQARFMAACDHGAGYASCPPAKVSHEFNQADKGTGILAKHAAGGMVKMKPPVLGAPPPVIGHQQSPLGSPLGLAIQNRGNAGRYAGGMGLAPARPPRVSMPGMMRNIDQGVKRHIQLKALGGRLEAPPQQQQQAAPDDSVRVQQVVMIALKHLEAMDASSAAAVLGSSPEAMAHPEIAAIAHALRTSTGIAPATKSLDQISQAGSESSGQPLQRLMPPIGGPAGGPPAGGAQPPQPQQSAAAPMQ